jgi:hypothetical protein
MAVDPPILSTVSTSPTEEASLPYQPLGRLEATVIRVLAWMCLILGCLGVAQLAVDAKSFTQSAGPGWLVPLLYSDSSAELLNALVTICGRLEGVFLLAGGLALLRRRPAARWWLLIYVVLATLYLGLPFSMQVGFYTRWIRLGMSMQEITSLLDFFAQFIRAMVLPTLIAVLAFNKRLSHWLQR